MDARVSARARNGRNGADGRVATARGGSRQRRESALHCQGRAVMRLTNMFHRSRTRAAGAMLVGVLGVSLTMANPASAASPNSAAARQSNHSSVHGSKDGLKNGAMKAAVDSLHHGRQPKSVIKHDSGLVVE